ncbi:hypothetical protein [Thalassobacillus sp. C254]|uniref:hypothetical protein n=1 Tax=Thalassobacillus sp. C254 TaxID=1225341 RepID=UPI0006D03058|nr:hypothetical protein [Thalassobacillus sp. C254]
MFEDNDTVVLGISVDHIFAQNVFETTLEPCHTLCYPTGIKKLPGNTTYTMKKTKLRNAPAF